MTRMRLILLMISIFHVIIKCNGETEEEIAVTVSSGAFFEDIQEATLYDKSIPLIYTQQIQNNYLDNLENTWFIENYCNNKNTNYCNITRQTLNLLKIINQNVQENEIDISNALREILINTKKSKRGIQFLGNIYHFCCNVATERQLKNLYTNEDMLNEQIIKFKNVFASDHKDLVNITSELNKYTKNINNKFESLKDSFKEFVMEEKINNILGKPDHENTVQGLQEVIYNLMAVVLKFTNYERDSSTHLHCKVQKIPPRIVQPDIMHKDLLKLSDVLKEDGYELVIPIHNLPAYYNIPITECQFSKTQILIKIKIPIREQLSNWKLFQYIPTHFKFNDSICLIFSEKTYIAINTENNEHRIISGVGLQHCDPPVTELCYIPKFSSDITLSPRCVESIFKNKPLKILNQYCYFQCVKQHNDRTIIIKQIGINVFAVTNPQPTIMARRKINNQLITEILKINYNHPGLLKISLPCNYELLHNETILIPKMYPCEISNQNKFNILRVLPISWTNIKSIKINHEEQKEKLYFSNITEILNENWTSDIPNFHITTQIKDPDKYFSDIVLKKLPQPYIDEYLSYIICIIWLSILTFLIIFMAYKIYPALIKIDFISLPPPIPP